MGPGGGGGCFVYIVIKRLLFFSFFGRLSRNLYLCWTEIENGKDRN